MKDHRDLRLARGVIIGRVLAARDLRACERAGALIDEWVTYFPDDLEMLSYGSFVLRMRSALLRIGVERDELE